MWSLVSTLIFGILCCLSYKYTARPRHFPTGPWNLPIVGYLPILGLCPHITLSNLTRKYGDIFSINIAGYRTVILSSYELVKEAMKEETFMGRPPFPLFAFWSNNKGILFSEGHNWSEVRRFALRHLRDLGFGKSSLEGIIHEEIRELIQSFKCDVGKPINLQNTFNLAVLNALWTITTGKRFDLDDPIAKGTLKTFSQLMFDGSAIRFSLLIPIVRQLKGLPVQATNLITTIKSMIRDNIIDHKKNRIEGDASDFTHVFLNKIQQDDEKGKPTPFTGEDGMANLIISELDLFTAGSETTSSTLLWLFLLLSVHPDVQEKVHQELLRVVGEDRLPSWDDKTSMTYTEAVLLECQRFASLIPITLHHCTADTNLKQYVIPKDTIVMPNLYHILHDPKVWEKPGEFYPEHFLTKDGTVKHVAQFIPFGIGKRLCIGESLAKIELFLFATALLQKFKFALPAGKPKPSLVGKATLLNRCFPYEVILTLRN